MKAKHLSLAIAALFAAGGLWFAGSVWRKQSVQKSSMAGNSKMPRGPNFDLNSADSLARASETALGPGSNNRPKPGQMLNSPARLAPPDPNRRFTDFTPEQRVQFAREGHGPGG